MADKDSAIQQDVLKDEKQERTLSPREEAMNRIAAQRNELFEQESGVKLDAAPEPVVEATPETEGEQVAAVEPAIDAAAQVKAQTDDVILDEDTLSRAKVRVKVNGQEELVPASKALGQYQKGAAADIRLADATRMQREAQAALDEQNRLLAEAQQRAASAGTKEERVSAKAEAEAAGDGAAKLKQGLEAMYEGDTDRAAQLINEAISAGRQTTVGRETAIPQDDIVRNVTQAVRQQLSVERALEQLSTDYPEIRADADYAMLADRYRESYEANGMSRAEAIVAAGEAIGEKFALGKHAKSDGRQQGGVALTTSDERLNAKREGQQRLPTTGARASSTEPAPLTVHQTIAEIAASRPGSRVV